MIGYSEIVAEIKKLPRSWLPGLFTVVVEQCLEKGVFKENPDEGIKLRLQQILDKDVNA